jgi:hypothetical protein
MDNFSSAENLNGTKLVFDMNTRDYLLQTSKWGRFVAGVGLLLVGLGLLTLFLTITIFEGLCPLSDEAPVLGFLGTSSFLIITYIFSMIYFIPFDFLWKFSTRMKIALDEDNQEVMNESFKNLKSLYKFMGIYLVVVLLISVILFVFGAIVAPS